MTKRRTRRAKTRASNPQRKRDMNGLETDYYHEVLLPQVLAGEMLKAEFEGLSVKLAKGARYKPDFYCLLANGEIELHETKGHWREAARLRIKMAADLHPEFRFVAIQKGKRKLNEPRWKTEEF